MGIHMVHQSEGVGRTRGEGKEGNGDRAASLIVFSGGSERSNRVGFEKGTTSGTTPLSREQELGKGWESQTAIGGELG